MLGSSVETTSVLKCSVYIKLKDSRLRVFLWCMSQTSRDRVNSHRVRTHEKNSGDAVRRLGIIIQSIFFAQSGASIRLTVWKWSGESRYPGALPPMLENFRRAFSPGPTDCPWVSEDEWYFHKRKNFNTFQFLLVHLLSVLLIFLVIVVCRTPAAMLIFLSC